MRPLNEVDMEPLVQPMDNDNEEEIQPVENNKENDDTGEVDEEEVEEEESDPGDPEVKGEGQESEQQNSDMQLENKVQEKAEDSVVHTTRIKQIIRPDCANSGPKQNIMFLKMQQCHSNIVQNILYRYGEKNTLNFVIPNHGCDIEGPPYKDFIPLQGGQYNIWCQHSTFNDTGGFNKNPFSTMFFLP